MPVVYGRRSARVFSAITISSSEQLPARSPMPLIVHSTWRAPAWIAASELATDSPRSSWQWTLTIPRPARPSTTVRMMVANSSGIEYPTVSGMLTVLAPASTTAREISTR